MASGIRLVTEAMPDVASVAIGFFVGTGSRDETDDIAGASHFLEHLLFKGTPSRSAADIAEALDEVGGDCNAFTTKEYTVFYIRLLAEHFDLGFDILSDILTEPALRPDEVDAERHVILDEIAMHNDEPQDLAGEGFMAALYPSHPLGRDVIGTARTVAGLESEQIRSFFNHHYRPANMVVAVAGAFASDAVTERVTQRFGSTVAGTAPARLAPGAEQSTLSIIQRPTEQAHLAFGTRSVPSMHDDRFALALFNQILGGGLSSRLFQKVREQRGLAYSIYSERAGFTDTGIFTIGAGTNPTQAAEVLELSLAELESLALQGPTARELEVAKASLRAETLLSAEDSGSRMHRIGLSMLLQGEVVDVPEMLGRLDEITTNEVRRVADTVMRAPRTLCAVGPVGPDALDADVLGAAIS